MSLSHRFFTNNLLFVILLVTLSCPIFAQSGVSCNCGDIPISIPSFKEDSIQSFRNEFVSDSIIDPITSSTSELEIRLYTHNGPTGYLSGSVYVIKCNAGKMYGQQTEFYYNGPLTLIPPFKIAKVIRGDGNRKGNSGWASFRYCHPVVSDGNGNEIIRTLIRSNLFALEDAGSVIQSYIDKGKVVLDADSSRMTALPPLNLAFWVEIKVKNRYRNYRIAPYYYKTNKSILPFKHAVQLQYLFLGQNSLFTSSKTS